MLDVNIALENFVPAETIGAFMFAFFSITYFHSKTVPRFIVACCDLHVCLKPACSPEMILIIIINMWAKKCAALSAAFLFCLLAFTFRADAVYLQPVRYLPVAMLFDQFVLSLFQLFAVYLHESSAFGADQMVVVLMAVLVFVSLYAVTEIDCAAESRLAKQLHRPGDRSIADGLVFLFDYLEQFLRAHMLFGTQKHADNRIPRPGLT